MKSHGVKKSTLLDSLLCCWYKKSRSNPTITCSSNGYGENPGKVMTFQIKCKECNGFMSWGQGDKQIEAIHRFQTVECSSPGLRTGQPFDVVECLGQDKGRI